MALEFVGADGGTVIRFLLLLAHDVQPRRTGMTLAVATWLAWMAQTQEAAAVINRCLSR